MKLVETDSILQLNEIVNTLSNTWWLNANPKIWKLSDMKVNEIEDYNSYTQTGTKRRIFKHFQNLKIGDKIIGYVTFPESYIDSICEVTNIFKEKDEVVRFEFKKIEQFKNPVTLNELKSIPELENCEPIINNQGSLFKVTDEEYENISLLIDEKNPKTHPNKPIIYTSEHALSELFIEERQYDEICNILKYKKNIILQGPPGVGKTFIAKRIAYSIMGVKDTNRVQMIQFHQSYSYEDFIQGYRPTESGGFERKDGVFFEFCKKAQRDPDNSYFFIIDEINRGNLSKIFGELMMLIEKDKRGKEFAIPMTYSKSEDETFYIPANLYFIGTMNTADRSLAMVDYALRRRFGFVSLQPAFELSKYKDFLLNKNMTPELADKVIRNMKKLNENISADNKNLGEGYQIGHSYFCPDGNEADIDENWYKGVINNEIKPLLNEYWFDNPDKVKEEINRLLS
jgi:5-methylcytosine-specific restriction enzyme B